MSAAISSFLYMAASVLRSTFRILPRSGSTAWKRRSRACLALPPACVLGFRAPQVLRHQTIALKDTNDMLTQLRNACDLRKQLTFGIY